MAIKQSALKFDFTPDHNKPEEQPGKQDEQPAPQTAEIPLTVQEPIVLEDEVLFRQSETKPIATKKSGSSAENPKKSQRGRIKLSDMNAEAELIQVPDDSVLFEKSYYSIGAVSEMFKVNQSLIRFWENEFSILKPKKNAKGDRFFRPEDVKNLKLIYHLLRERKYTMEGAKEFLKKNKNADKKFEMIESLKNLKSFLFELKANL